MRIVFIGGKDVPGPGGIESYLYNLGKELVSLGNEVTIICRGHNTSRRIVEGITIVRYKCPDNSNLGIPLLFFRSIPYICKQRKKIDVINCQTVFLAFIVSFIAKLCGIKTAYTQHSFGEDNPKHSRMTKLIIRFVHHCSLLLINDNIITISNSKAKDFQERYHCKSVVIPCGVNLPKTNSKDTNILSHFAIKKNNYYLIICRLDPIKNLNILIEATRNRSNNTHQVVIAGSYESSYGQSLIESAKGCENIIFTGPVMGDDKETLLKYCFANILISSSEGMPISLLEAMAYAKPCIVSDIPAIREIIQAEDGLWCEQISSDCLIKQMDFAEENITRINEMGIRLKKYVEANHSWNKIANSYLNYITSIQ